MISLASPPCSSRSQGPPSCLQVSVGVGVVVMRFLQAARRRPGRVTRALRRVAQRHDRRTAPLAPISDGSGCDGEAPRELVEEAVEGVRYFTGDLIGHCKGHHQLCARLVPGPDDEQVERRHALRSEEHTSELQSLMRISYAVFCLKK